MGIHCSNNSASATEVELFAGFRGEVIAAVFGFPEAVGEAEVVEQRAAHAERVLARAADFPFGDEGPVVLAGAVVEQALKSGADGGFVGDAEVVKLAQGRIVILDRLVRWLEFQPLHGGVLHQWRGEGQSRFESGWHLATSGCAPEAGGFRGLDATHSELRVILRHFPSVGPRPLCPWRSNAGLSDAIPSGLAL